MQMNCTRRGWLALAMLAAAGCKSAGGLARSKGRLAVQLWSVRKLCEKDFPGTLAALKKMGYEGIQCGGFFGRDAKQLRSLFDGNGLLAAGVQMQPAALSPDKRQASFDFAQTIGAQQIFVPWYAGKTEAEWKKLSDLLSETAEAAPAGLRIGYHNHQHEFRQKWNDICVWEWLYRNVSPKVCQQLDIGHCTLAGEDPVKWIRAYPGRIPCVHVKAGTTKSGVIGGPDDRVQWPAALAACDAVGTDWRVVEAEIRPDTLDEVRASIDFLKKM